MKKTIIIGICEVNYRRYFVGMWPDIETCTTQLDPIYTVREYPLVSEETWGPAPQDYNAVRHYGACDTGIDSEEAYKINPHVHAVGGDVDGFSLYEIDVDNLSGFIGFDED